MFLDVPVLFAIRWRLDVFDELQRSTFASAFLEQRVYFLNIILQWIGPCDPTWCDAVYNHLLRQREIMRDALNESQDVLNESGFAYDLFPCTDHT